MTSSPELMTRAHIRLFGMLVGAFAVLMTPTYASAHKAKVREAKTAMQHDASMPEHAAMMGATKEPPKPFGARLTDWLGRFHPMLVHFPIAFIPAALFTAIVGRRRPGFGKPVQFLVVTGGITALVATVAGWLGGGMTLGADDWVMQSHRWLGTGIGLGAFVLALWAVRRPDMDRSGAMIVGLSVLTAAIVVQGWFGGALVHGVDHLNW
jgi:uncharacterized membrane protein